MKVFFALAVAVVMVASAASECHRDHDEQHRFTHTPDQVKEHRKPSETLHDLCESGNSHHKHEHYSIEIKHFDKKDCHDAVQYAKEHEKHERDGQWVIYREFKCGRMTVIIDH